MQLISQRKALERLGRCPASSTSAPRQAQHQKGLLALTSVASRFELHERNAETSKYTAIRINSYNEYKIEISVACGAYAYAYQLL